MPVRLPTRLRRAALALVLASLVGCTEQSQVDPEADVRITGTALTAAGAPLASRPVRLGTGVPGDDAALAVLTAGLACATGVCSGSTRDTTTGADGGYAFALKGADTQGSFGGVKSVLVSVSAAPVGQQVTGPSASARFVVQRTEVALPSLRLVDPLLAVRGSGSQVVSSWRRSAAGPYTLTFEAGQAIPTWLVTTAGTTSALDPRVLEGTAGQAVLSAATRDRVEGSDVELRWRSPGVAYASDVGAPASRGAACRASVPGGESTAVEGACGLTDGDLTGALLLPEVCPPGGDVRNVVCARATRASVELPSAARADLVVVRGCVGTCAVEASADGTRFESVGSATGPYSAVRLSGRSVRAVRVGLGDAGLREVSVWEPRPAGPALRPVAAPVVKDLRARYDPRAEEDSRSRLVPYVVAGLLVLVLLVTVAFLLGRRTPRSRAAGRP